jgi:aquaporin Z
MNTNVKLLTEFVGTFLFLTAIALSAGTGLPLTALVIGSALMVMVYMGGHISGGHYNPAVSLGVFLRGKLSARDLGLYWVVQFAAAVAAFAFGYLVKGSTPGIHPGEGVNAIAAVAVEAVFTMALVLVVLNVAVSKATAGNSFYGLAIGFTIVVAVFAGAPISGGAFNPAVGFGATVGGVLFDGQSVTDLWIYIVGPAIGAALAAGIYAVQTAGTEQAPES